MFIPLTAIDAAEFDCEFREVSDRAIERARSHIDSSREQSPAIDLSETTTQVQGGLRENVVGHTRCQCTHIRGQVSPQESCFVVNFELNTVFAIAYIL